ncbi:hypothetical protein [Sphingomicrobium clamense]|uniref:Uncharacterized protein n=1 Tax=Sphingomicrobium clamense TaxID=2851013 RepID=A0ABS6V4A9_9SPHN|nr:hypothetical protein [Sphingomicrobium sp. B8]MBW0144390.1 hypothetical protein [Sphingomicrobium sp. B8]
MQRIRIGVTGLAFVFLLVLLGTAIGTQRADQPEVEDDLSVFVEEAPSEPAEPLAELGAAPGQASSEPEADVPPDPSIDSESDVILDELARPSGG